MEQFPAVPFTLVRPKAAIGQEDPTMRKLTFLLLLVGVVFPAYAARRVTVVQLEQLLEASQGKPDAEVAKQLSDLELTERLSPARFAHSRSTLPGERAQQAFVALADRSAFLDLPTAEIPSTPVPDFATQRQIMALVVRYVSKTIPLLPNFTATRATERFEDTPQKQTVDLTSIQYQPLHPVAGSSATVLYQDGREVVDPGPGKNPKPGAPEPGLSTWGAFGPILATVLVDAAQSKLSWGHWEPGPSGPLAVFTYAVPKEKSHYEVDYCCVPDSDHMRSHVFHQLAGYHGEIAADAATGTILRLKLEAGLKSSDPVSMAGMVVEYGPMEIGGKTYYCPTRSIALSRAQSFEVVHNERIPTAPGGATGAFQSTAGANLTNIEPGPPQTLLNDVAFEQYHLFRADSRVLPETEAALADSLPPLGSGGTAIAGNAGASPAPARPADKTAPESAPAPIATTSTPVTATVTPPASAPPPPADNGSAEISVTDASGIPDSPTNLSDEGAARDPGFTLHTTARLVDVGLVAFDKKGQPVTDLKSGDLEIYDNGRKQEIRFFSQAGAETPEQPAAPGQPAFSNRRAPNDGSKAGAQEPNSTLLLLDESNLAFGDLTYAREEVLRFLKTVPASEPVGLYLMKSHGFQILMEATTDRATLASALTKWMPSAQDLSRAQEEEARNRQDIEYVHSIADLLHVNGNMPTGAQDSSMAIDPQLRSLGSNPAWDILVVLPGIARHLASVTGHKSLVWVASDNVLADFSDKAPSVEKGNKYLEPLTLGAQEALNEAHISIYPLDVSQLEAGGVAASVAQNSVQVNPATNIQAQLAALTPSERQEAEEALEKSQRNIYPGRLSAQMQQDTHPIQGTFRELAQATGGRAFRRSSDIASELNGVIADGRAAYLLSFTPDQPADGKYHLLTMKLTGRRDITLRYRTGYVYSKEPATLKDRFRQAIWQPMDASEIGIGANPASSAGDTTVRLNIAATDLGLALQGQLFVDKLDIFMVQRDDAALHAQVTGQTLGLRLKPGTYQRVLQEGIPFDQALSPRPETGSVRIVVVDENSGRMGSITLPAAVIAGKQ